MASIRFAEVSKRFPDGSSAVRDLSFEVGDGERLVLVGPSGCGKSTTLRLLAGLEAVSAGRIHLGAEDVTEKPPQERNLAMVFQSYALYPHKTVRENLAFPLRMQKMPRAAIHARIEEVASSLEIDGLLERRPGQLSGGQRQRVALGRALVREPAAFLFDEPLSNLDAALRVRTRAELVRLHRRLGTTMVYVTHDQEEAMTLGDRIAVMRGGVIEQIAAPLEVYRRPASLFVATFVGSPPMNVLPCEVCDRGVQGEGWFLELARALPRPGTKLHFGVRPTDLEIVPPERGLGRATIDVVETLGATSIVHLEGAARWVAVVAAPFAGRAGDVVGIRFHPEIVHLFAADEKRIPET